MNILEKHGIQYDDAAHAYTRAGFAVPSVTQILPFKCDGPEDVIAKAAARGQRVHRWIEWWEQGDRPGWLADAMLLSFAECEWLLAEDAKYCEAWLKFKEVTGFELARLPISSGRLRQGDDGVFRVQQTMALAPLTPMVERFIYHKDFQYVGRLDLIGYLRRIPKIANDLTLVDAKTVAKLYSNTALQTAAYMMAINQELKALGLPLVKHRWAAQLKPDGTCRRASYEDDKGDFSTFLAYLNVTRWETAHGESLPDDPFTAPAQREPEEVMARL